MPKHQVADGAEIYYEDYGQGVPVVLICSGNATHRMWEEQVVGLGPEHRIITLDWRGTGQSDVIGEYTAERAVADIASLIQDRVQGQAVVGGHGMGGHLAILLARKFPELVSGLLVASSGPWYSGEKEGKAGGMSLEFIEGSSAGTGMSYPDVLAKMTDDFLFHKPVSEITRTATILQQLEWPLYVLDEYDRDMRDLDHQPYLSEIHQPTLVLHGKHDQKQRFEGTEVFKQEMQDVQLVVFEDSAHCPHAEETEKFNEAIRKFIETKIS